MSKLLSKEIAIVAFVAVMATIFLLGKISNFVDEIEVAQAAGITYYVATNGSDSNAGTSASPFRTIQKGVDTAGAGDTVVVRNGVYTGSGTYAVSINRSGNANNWITIKAENTWGAVIDGQQSNHSGMGISSGTGYVRIEGFEIKNARSGGISGNASGIHDMVYFKNLIHHIGGYCTDTSSGIVGFRDNDDNNRITYDSNVIHSIGRLTPADGCNYSTNNYRNHDHGLYIDGQNLTIVNNIFYNNIRGWGIQASGGAANWVVANNIFADPNPDRDGDIVLWEDNSNITIANNIFYNTRGAMIDVSECGKSNIVVRDNISTTGSVLSGDNCSGFTLTNNRLNTDPRLVNPAVRDYHLRSDSPAINTANASFAPNLDFEGNLRPQGSSDDVGPFEFGGTGTPTPVPDTTAPNISITSPSNGSSVNGTITLAATAVDPSSGSQTVSGVAGVQFRLNGNNIGAEDTSSPYSISWNTTAVANGTQIITAVARDNTGNTKVSSNLSVTISNAVPTPVPTLNLSVSNSSIQAGQSATLSWSSSNATSCTASNAWSGSKSILGSQNVSPTSNSTYTLTCSGAGGNISRSVTVSVTQPTPVNQKPIGFLDGVNSAGQVFGWAQDPDSPNSALVIHLYFDRNAGTSGASPVAVVASDNRNDVGSHAFNYTVPDNFRDGQNHQVWTWAIDLNDATGGSNVQLSGSPKSFNITPPQTPAPPQQGPSTLYQAESFTLNLPFTAKSDSNASGGMYISASSGSESNNPTRQASLNFNLSSAGTYYLWARMMGPTEESDALYIGIDSTWDRVFFDDVIGFYGWVRVETGINNSQHAFSLTSGNHTFQVGLGELNARLDALYLTSSASEVPTFGPSTTPTPEPVPPLPDIDTTPPSVSITSPANGTQVNGVVTVSASASDPQNSNQSASGVAGVQFKLNGINLGSEDTTSPYGISWNTTAFTNGTQTITAVARDNAGNTGTASNITVTVSNTVPIPAPTLTFNSSASPIQQGQSATLSWSTTNASSCSASGAWSGSRPTSGSQSVSPSSTSNYALTCTGSGGSVNRSVSVSVSTPTPPQQGPSTLYQAESFTLNLPFTAKSDSNASGGMYISASSGSESNNPTRQASLNFNLSSSGTYYLWARIMGPTEESDALYIGIDSTWDRVFFDDVIGFYGWVRVETGINNSQHAFSLTSGNHTFQVGLGELNARLDALYLTSSASEVPTFGPSTTPSPVPPVASLSLEGKLFKYSSSATVYLFENGYKRPIESLAVLRARFPSQPIAILPSSVAYPSGQPVSFGPGILMRGTNSSATYLILDNGSRYPFRNTDEFYDFGYRFNQIVIVSDAVLAGYPVAQIDRLTYHATGNLIYYSDSSSRTVYYIQNGIKRPISSLSMFYAYATDFSKITVITNRFQYPTGPSIGYPNGMLIKGSNSAVYYIENGMRRPFRSQDAFLRQGYSYSQVLPVSDADLSLNPIGSVIE